MEGIMKEKVLVQLVRTCSECGFCQHDENDILCLAKSSRGRRIDVNIYEDIPDWCPLYDKSLLSIIAGITGKKIKFRRI